MARSEYGNAPDRWSSVSPFDKSLDKLGIATVVARLSVTSKAEPPGT